MTPHPLLCDCNECSKGKRCELADCPSPRCSASCELVMEQAYAAGRARDVAAFEAAERRAHQRGDCDRGCVLCRWCVQARVAEQAEAVRDDSIFEGEQLGRGQSEPHVTQQAATTPDHDKAIGNVAESQDAPRGSLAAFARPRLSQAAAVAPQGDGRPAAPAAAAACTSQSEPLGAVAAAEILVRLAMLPVDAAADAAADRALARYHAKRTSSKLGSAAVIDRANVEQGERFREFAAKAPPLPTSLLATFTGDLDTSDMTVHPFTGLRCDAPDCGVQLRGSTSSNARVRQLVLRAETLGWQCVHADGVSMQFCPEHVDPDRLRLRKLR